MPLALALAGAPAPAGSQSISPVAAMSFGNFIAGGGGTVTISPGGLRTQSGGVVLVGQGSTYSAASFRVSGTASATYTITLPPYDTVSLSDGFHTMALNSFVSSPPTGTLSGAGSQMIMIGATLVVGAAQPPGSYTATFNVTVNY
ncbi:MAG TPA: DUF4402 domain-containing protein [Caldimonas sp.]